MVLEGHLNVVLDFSLLTASLSCEYESSLLTMALLDEVSEEVFRLGMSDK